MLHQIVTSGIPTKAELKQASARCGVPIDLGSYETVNAGSPVHRNLGPPFYLPFDRWHVYNDM
jgi:hypothetical protein